MFLSSAQLRNNGRGDYKCIVYKKGAIGMGIQSPLSTRIMAAGLWGIFILFLFSFGLPNAHGGNVVR